MRSSETSIHAFATHKSLVGVTYASRVVINLVSFSGLPKIVWELAGVLEDTVVGFVAQDDDDWSDWGRGWIKLEHIVYMHKWLQVFILLCREGGGFNLKHCIYEYLIVCVFIFARRGGWIKLEDIVYMQTWLQGFDYCVGIGVKSRKIECMFLFGQFWS